MIRGGRQYGRGACIAIIAIMTGVLIAGCTVPLETSGMAQERSVITLWRTLNGAPLNPNPNPALGALPGARPLGFLPWISPIALASRGSFLYVADSGRGQIFRYDLVTQEMSPFAGFAQSAVLSLAVAPDLSLYVADINARQVAHYATNGKLIRMFEKSPDVARPVAIVLDDRTSELLIADSLYNHVVVFNSLGHAGSVLKSLETRNIDAMSGGPDGLYLLDRLGQQIVVLGRDGRDRYTIRLDTLKDPKAIAVDAFNRVFVSDGFDNTINVYEQGNMVASFGGTGATIASFNRITGLWLDRNMLYVTDSVNARVVTFHVNPPTERGRVHE
jgi:hypothetical protein